MKKKKGRDSSKQNWRKLDEKNENVVESIQVKVESVIISFFPPLSSRITIPGKGETSALLVLSKPWVLAKKKKDSFVDVCAGIIV